MWRLRWRLAGPGPAIVDPVHGFVEAAEDKEMKRNENLLSRGEEPQELGVAEPS